MYKAIVFLAVGLLAVVALLVFSVAEVKSIPASTQCTHSATGISMSWTTAMGMAQTSECLAEGSFEGAPVCNEDTGTWWIDLDIEKPGCNPACVIDVRTGEAEINWRCTGLVD